VCRRWLGLALLVTTWACTAPVLELPPPRPPGQVARDAPAAHPSGERGKPARAMVIGSDGDLVGGAEADGKRGDLRLENGKVAFIVDGPGSALGFADSGGNLIDAVPLGRCGGATCRDSIKQVFGYLDDSFPRQPLYDRVEPGQRGTTAFVRASGHDSQDPRLLITTEYELEPESNALEIVTRVTNTGAANVANYQLGDAIQWGRTERFTPGHGFAQPAPSSRELNIAEGWIAGIADDVTYAYVTDEASGLRGRHGSAWSNLNLKKSDLAPGQTFKVRRWLIVGATGDVAVGESLARLRGQAWPRLEGRILEQGTGVPLEGARVFLDDDAGQPVAFARSAQGRYQVLAPPGDYSVRAEARGRSGPDHMPVQLRGREAHALDLNMSPPGSLAFRVREGGTPSPAKLTFLGTHGTRSPNFGAKFEAVGHDVVITVDGQGRVELAPGRYEVIASRGPEFTAEAKAVEIAPGKEVEADFTLERAVDTRGYVCVDLHQHASPSPDAGVSLRDRAASNLAEGLEVMVASDHNAMVDWQPTLDALGATRPLRLVLGDEATLDGLGHWNAYPLALHVGQPRGGALDVRGLGAREIVAGLRAADGRAERVVQVNHPRLGNIGYFNNVKFEPRAGAPLPADWEGGFDAIEVLSSKDVSTADATLRDWFALLNRGLSYTAVGGSDSHLVWGQEVGYPRTCVAVGADYDAKNPGPALVDGIKRKRDALVTNGPFVRVAIAGRGMGQLAPAPRGKARLDVEVQAAPWVDARRIEVLVDGERRGKPVEIPQPQPGAPLRWKSAIELKVAEDGYVTVEVRGDVPLTPVLGQIEGTPPPLPLAITNPIYLDRDLDGKYTPPGKR